MIDALEGRLRPDEERLLAEDFWSISDISLWEIAYLARSKRIRLGPGDPRLRRVLREITVWPITLEVAQALGRLDFASDPADEIIAATSLVHEIPLLTRDMRMLSSKVVPLALR